MKVSKIIDQWGWAYYWIAKEMERYSTHTIRAERFNFIDYKSDVIYISSPNISKKIASHVIPLNCKENNIKCIGGYSGEIDMLYSEYVDLIVTISPQLYYYAKNQYKNIPVIFLPESVDTNYFIPTERPKDRFIPGWAGGPNKAIKRRHLFEYFKYPVSQMCEHGSLYFKEDATLDKMKNFYSSIDCFVNVSSTECCPRVVLESMACGLPVLSTNVGAIPMLLEKTFIVPTYPVADTVYEMNKLLDNLANKIDDKTKIGERNRQYVEDNFSWKVNQPIWDEVFSLLKDNNITEILKISDKFIEKYPTVFIEEMYKEHITQFAKENS